MSFKEYVTTKNVWVGSFPPEGRMFKAGEAFEYDGGNSVILKGKEYEITTPLRSAIQFGWFKETGNVQAPAPQQPSRVKVRAAVQTEMTGPPERKAFETIQEPSRVVSTSVKPTPALPRKQVARKLSPAMQEVYDLVLSLSPETNIGTVVEASRRSFPVEISDEAENAGTVVSSVGSRPSIGGRPVEVVSDLQQMSISLSNNQAPIQLEESAQIRQVNTETVQLSKSAEVGSGGRIKQAKRRVLGPTSFKTEVGKNTRVVETTPKYEVVGTSGESLQDVIPQAAVAAPPVNADAAKYEAVRMFIPDFNWNKDRPTSERVKEAMTHVKNPQLFRGILAVETEMVKTALLEKIQKNSQ